jgi:hypothetical protein
MEFLTSHLSYPLGLFFHPSQIPAYPSPHSTLFPFATFFNKINLDFNFILIIIKIILKIMKACPVLVKADRAVRRRRIIGWPGKKRQKRAG